MISTYRYGICKLALQKEEAKPKIRPVVEEIPRMEPIIEEEIVIDQEEEIEAVEDEMLQAASLDTKTETLKELFQMEKEETKGKYVIIFLLIILLVFVFEY